MINNNLIEKEEYEQELDSRWSWLTEGINDKDIRLNTQLVLENSYKKMVGEGSVPRNWLNEAILSEGVIEEAGGLQRSGSVGDYVIPKVMFPIIRRVMPQLIANKLVSVQPLTAPTGVIYYITYNYSNTKGGVKAGYEASFNPQQTSPAYSTYYSSEKIGPFSKECTDGTADFTITRDTDDFGFLDTDAVIAATYKRVEIMDKTTHKVLIAKNVTYANSLITFSSNDGGTVLATVDVKASGDIEVTAAALKAVGADAASSEKGKAHKIVVFVVYNQEATSHIPEMEFEIDHMDVSTTERKLKVRWTKEAEQDMQAYHKIDVEQELIKVAAIQTNYEIDREIIEAIDDLVISDLTSTYDWDDTTTYGTAGNYLDKHRCLAQKMYQLCTKVAQFNHFGAADWAVVNPQIAAVLQMLPDWKAGEISDNKSTFYNAGQLSNGTVSVYVDPNRVSTSDGDSDITMGFKTKDSTYGAGLVYSPYANWMSGNVTDPSNFNSIRGTFSRYAITATPRAEYNYARMTVSGVEL